MAGIAFSLFPELSVYDILLTDMHFKFLLDGSLPSAITWDDIVELFPCKRDGCILVELTVISLNNLSGSTHFNLSLIILFFPEKNVPPLLVDGLNKLFQLCNLHFGIREVEGSQYKIPNILRLDKLFVQEDSLNGLAQSLCIVGTYKCKTAVCAV